MAIVLLIQFQIKVKIHVYCTNILHNQILEIIFIYALGDKKV